MDNRINAYYLRLSLEDGDVADGTIEESCSITSQRLCIQRFLNAHSELGTGFKEFVDDGCSGTNMERAGVQRLLKLVEMGQVKTIVVRDLSRFARNYLEAGHYLEFVFPAYGVRFISINDRYDSNDYGENPAGLDLAIRNLINEMYSKDISKKIKSAVDLKKRNGEYVYGTAPYGYKKGEVKNTIVPDDEAAIIVKKIFHMAADGKTITEIARYLNEQGYQTPSQHLAAYRSSKYKVYNEWTWNSVRNIIENRIYTGDTEPFKSHVVRIGSDRTKQIPKELREIIPDTHKALVSRELYYLAQTTIKSTRKSKPVSQRNPLTSKLVCGCCGSRLGKGKAKNKTWLCSKARYTSSLGCQNVRADEDRMKDIILRAIQQQCALVDLSLQEQRMYQKTQKSELELLEDEVRHLQRKHETIELQKRELLEAVLDDKLSRSEYATKKQVLISQDDAITGKLSVLQERFSELASSKQKVEQIQDAAIMVSQYRGIQELTPEVMNALVDKVIVYPDNRVRIEWKFADNILHFHPQAN